MRRPIVPAVGMLTFGIWLAYTFEEISTALWLSAAAFAAAVCLCAVLKRNSLTGRAISVGFFCLALLCGGALMSHEAGSEGEIAAAAGKYAEIEARVVYATHSEEDEKTSLLVKNENGEKILVNVYGDLAARFEGVLSCEEDLAGRRVIIGGVPELPKERRNPKTFDYRLYLKTRGIETVMSVSPLQVELAAEGFDGSLAAANNRISVFKARFAEALAAAAGERAASLTMGMLFGETANIDEDIEKAFRENGTSHILSVSGIHVAIVYMCVQKLARGRKNALISLITFALLIVYAAASQFSPSSVRAVAMIGMHIFASRAHLCYDMLSSAAATAAAALIYQPYMLFNTGFQLSYLAIFSLAVIMNAIRKYYDGFLLSAAAIQVGMAPATAYLFNYFSLSTVLANIPVIFISGFIIPVALVSMGAFALQAETLLGIMGVAVRLMNDLMILANEIFYNEGMYTLRVVSPPLFLLAVYYAGVFWGLSETALIAYKRKDKKKIAAAILASCLLAAGVHAVSTSGFERAEMVFVDVGQGDCLHIRSDNGKNILIDGGGSVEYDVGEKTLMPYLLKNGVGQIDYAFVTHLHEDHYGGIKSLARNGMIKKLFLYESNRVKEEEILAETGLKKENLEYLSSGKSVKIGTDTLIEVLWPRPGTYEEYEKTEAGGDENLSSLVMKVNKGGVTVLMTGDIDAATERKIAGMDLSASILKAAHHGSRYSTSDELLRAVDPELCIIQVGKNNYGHPHKSVIEKCLKNGIMIYRNDVSGAIGLRDIRNGRGEIVTVL